MSVLDLPLAVGPKVSVRRERFGALLYQGTRRLPVPKDLKLLFVIERLGDSATARDACATARVADDPECVKGHGEPLVTAVVSGSTPRPDVDHSAPVLLRRQRPDRARDESPLAGLTV